MLTDSKLTNHGKQVNSGAPSQIPNVNQQQHQGPTGSLGSKGVGAGNHGAKPNQMSPGNSGLKSGSVGGGLKGKAKRERSVSADAPDQRDALQPDTKDGVMRRKRRCVLEKKQPYSGDEWCSGADTEEEEEKLPVAPHRELSMASSVQPLTVPAPHGPISESGGPALGRGAGPALHTELPRPHEQVVYVFTTSLANSAAEAVINGHAESILLFHQQNVPRTKLGQCTPGKLPSLSELTSSGTPPMGTPKSQSATPRPASVGGVMAGHLHSVGTPTSAGLPETEPPPMTRTGNGHSGTLHQAEGPSLLPRSSAAVSPSPSPGHLQGEAVGPRAEVGGANGSMSQLSREQLEHRERSLQTLRDIERLLLRGGAPGPPNMGGNSSPNINNLNPHCPGEPGGPQNCGANNGVLKKFEEPLQSIISQTQSLGGPAMDEPHPHPHLSSPPGPVDMGPILGLDSLTPEQVAWRKLQEEYYQEKRRQQQDLPPYRMLPDMGMCVIRGPPPPYHSKPGDPQWAPGMGDGAMGGGGNGRLIEMHGDGPRGPRFIGQMQRGLPRGGMAGFPGNMGGVLPMDAMVHQRPPRPGMGWLEDVPPNLAGGGPFPMCYPPGDAERVLTREEMFRLLEKRQLQRLSKQQAGLGAPRMMHSPGGFPTHPRGEPMDFPSMRAMMGSPGPGGAGGPPLRDFVDSPLGPSFGMNVNINMSPQMSSQQQQMILAHKLRAGLGGVARGSPGSGGGIPMSDMLSPEEIAQIRAAQNGRGGGKGMMGGPLQFPNQGPFTGLGGGYLSEEGPDMFGPDQQGGLHPQVGGMSRLSHMPLHSGPRGVEMGPRHPPDLSVNVNPMESPAMPPPPRLKSPSLSQDASPLLPSPSASAPGLKSPTGPPASSLPPSSSGAGPMSSSIKSPQVMGPSSLGLRSPSESPGRLHSPTMPMASPGWTVSPKPALSSPAGPPSSKAAGNSGGSSIETGQSLPQRSSNSTPLNQPASTIPSMPFTSSPGAPPNQNPLSLIMSQMSKYAMPSSTPLYHEAIKTIATSDDEMPPDRPPMAGALMAGNVGNHQPSHQMLVTSQSSMGPHSGPQSPLGMVLQGQPQLSHDPSGSLLHSPNTMGIPGLNPVMMGAPPDSMGPCNLSPMLPQNQMGGFPRLQTPSQGSLHSPSSGMGQQYPQPPPEDVLPPQSGPGLVKRAPFQPPLSLGDGPDLSEVIRATPTGIPEFDLSRIIPSDKPSSTLQYFPKNNGLKPHPSSASGPTPSSNPHIANLQNMMAEQQLGPPPHPGMRPGQGVAPGGPRGGGMGPMCHPGPPMSRAGLSPQQQHHLQQQQAMMANSLLHHPHPAMTPSPQHQHSLMMMQAKHRGGPVHGDPYVQQGPLMMGPPHPQSGMMGPQALRHRGMSLDSPLSYGPGGMANAPF
ncbi:hypothetical protein GJAV_G00052630 [Gymnothorax javanicus]|nr:hypothetical protein GJAV_G00052630 [Gymnothorax javanicus]